MKRLLFIYDNSAVYNLFFSKMRKKIIRICECYRQEFSTYEADTCCLEYEEHWTND